MDEFQRYGIYALPPAGSLAEFGAQWLGWDVAAGCERDHPDVDDPALDVAAITAVPRKYGFHGTIKPPFRLAPDQDANALRGALAALCADAPPVETESLELSGLGRFLALEPVGDQTDLAALAGRVVRDLDRFRAPPSESELARRRARPLSAAEDANLSAWGYPYVMDQFRFHMTLTGPIADDAVRAQCRAVLDALVTPMLPRPFRLESLCLVGSDAAGRFRLIARCPLTGIGPV